ncbi:hypothetical protein E05_02410 [Plautia stali symbiont]|nr:hypothetical protein E05_02410 [Plautia stali symbiont]
MNINSTVISGYQALNDLSYLLQDKQKALLVTDKNILGIPAVQALIARLQQQIASLSLVDTVPPEPSQHAAAGIAHFNVLNGPDLLIHQGFVEGCSACISGLANVAPKEINAIWARFHAGDIAGSRAAQENVTGLRTDLYSIGFSPAAVKKAVALLGYYEVGDSRYAVRFSAEEEQKIRQIVNQYLQ